MQGSLHRRVFRIAGARAGLGMHPGHSHLPAYVNGGKDGLLIDACAGLLEKLHFFVADSEPGDRRSAGGGDAAEGEDIEVLELPLADALRMVSEGLIQDGKTILLLQHAALTGLQRLLNP
jgi:hypothetical protein